MTSGSGHEQDLLRRVEDDVLSEVDSLPQVTAEESAKRYEARSKTEVPATRAGTLVVRAAGPAAEEIAAALSAALR